MNVLPRGGYPAQRPASIYPPNATRNRTATRFSGLQQDTVHLDHKPAGQQASAKVVPAAAQAVREDIYSLANPLTSTVLSNEKIADDTHKITFQVDDTLQWEPGQAIMVKCPDTILNNTGDGPHTAAYSIANHYEPGNKTLELLVKRLKKPEADGSTYRGRCSNYLCDLKPGEKAGLFGPVNHTLVLPHDPNINVIAVAGGTGLSPIRAELSEREQAAGHATMVFYGAKNPQNELCRDDLETFAQSVPGAKVVVAYSASVPATERQTKNNPTDNALTPDEIRDLPDVSSIDNAYVQDAVHQDGKQVLKLLEKPNTYFMFCGSNAMLKGLMETMDKICQENGKNWQELYARLLSENRWRVESA